jgi:hypothetical protein
MEVQATATANANATAQRLLSARMVEEGWRKVLLLEQVGD